MTVQVNVARQLKSNGSSWSEAAISSDNEAVRPANLVTPETRRRIAISHLWLQNRLKAILRSSKDAMRTTPRLQIEETARCVSQPAQVLKQPAGINIWRSKQNLDERERVGQAASEGGSDTLAQPSCARDWATEKRHLSACALPPVSLGCLRWLHDPGLFPPSNLDPAMVRVLLALQHAVPLQSLLSLQFLLQFTPRSFLCVTIFGFTAVHHSLFAARLFAPYDRLDPFA
jgi:hypothetical protein